MNDIVVTCVNENDDGSADFEVEFKTSESKMRILEEGIQFVFIKGVLGGSNDDIFRWAELGKQQENTDRLVDAFSKIYNEDTK